MCIRLFRHVAAFQHVALEVEHGNPFTFITVSIFNFFYHSLNFPIPSLSTKCQSFSKSKRHDCCSLHQINSIIMHFLKPISSVLPTSTSDISFHSTADTCLGVLWILIASTIHCPIKTAIYRTEVLATLAVSYRRGLSLLGRQTLTKMMKHVGQ